MTTPADGFPMPAFCAVEQVDTETGHLSVLLRSQQPTSNCPRCAQPSQRIQSHYTRHLSDLPSGGLSVEIRLRVRRFYCDNTACTRRIFAERFCDWLQPYARRTARLQTLVGQIGYALGGTAGARLAEHCAITISADTILRQLHRWVTPPYPTPTALGVDDWSYRRGRRFGTVLVDLERHQPIDLLPDREADTFVAWLKAHPGIDIISRDRSGSYAEGARRGAPKAQQVADRWHLLKNLREAVERLINNHYAIVKQVAETHTPLPDEPSQPTAKTKPPSPSKPCRSRSTARSQRVEKYRQTRRLHQQGVPILQIAQRLKMARKTVRRYLNADTFPERAPRPRLPHHKIDPYLPYLQQRWAQDQPTVDTLWQEIVAQGFKGSRCAVFRAVKPWREKRNDAPLAPSVAPPSARRVSWWLMNLIQPPKKRLAPKDDVRHTQVRFSRRVFIQALCRQSPAIAQAQQLGNTFIDMIRQHIGAEGFEPWVEAVKKSNLHGSSCY